MAPPSFSCLHQKQSALLFLVFFRLDGHAEYDNMDLEMLQEVVPMLSQQLEKSMLDRNYVQLERVRACHLHTYLWTRV